VSSASHDYWVYIVTNKRRTTVYIGITNELRLRVWQHRNHSRPGSFSDRYSCGVLVYYEQFRDVKAAIAREKQLKGWRREKKNRLIESLNPQWNDLAADWFDDFG